MPESKKYWYIQLNVNFFDDERIGWLCEQKNGYAYVVLYLKLCLKTANNNGILTRQIGDMIIPYNVDKIAGVTHMDVDVVRVALELYKKIGLVYEADENCNFMRLPEVPGMVGCVTQAALDKRKQRERKQLELGQSQDNVHDNVQQELRVKSKELIDNSLDKEKGEKRSASAPLDFDRFWKAYPLKKAKQAALKAWKKINPDKQLAETIIAAVEKQKRWEDWTRDNGQYIPHPATWLNQGRWEDEERSGGEQKQKEKCIDTKYVYEQLEAAQKYWAERGEQGLNEQ